MSISDRYRKVVGISAVRFGNVSMFVRYKKNTKSYSEFTSTSHHLTEFCTSDRFRFADNLSTQLDADGQNDIYPIYKTYRTNDG